MLDDNLGELHYTNVLDNIDLATQLTWNFSRFRHLEVLSFAWHKPFTEKIIAVSPTKFINEDSFNGLENLRTLKINIPTTDITPGLLLNLPNLENLDLSYTAFLDTGKIVALWEGSRLGEKPIKKLILKKIIHVTSDLTFVPLIAKELFPLFENTSLELFDLTDNGDVLLSPGLLKYTPHLKVVRYGENRLRYDDGISDCVIADLWLHRKLIEFDMSGVDHVRPIIYIDREPVRPVHSLPITTMQRLHQCKITPGCTLCQLYNAMCGTLLGYTPCDRLPLLDDVYEVDQQCTGGLKLIMPPNLKKMSFNDTVIGFLINKETTPDEQVVCFQKNNLKVFDASRVTFPYTGEGVKTFIRGWDHLEEFRMEDSDWVFLFANKELLHSMPSLRILRASGPMLEHFIANDKNGTILAKSTNLEELYIQGSKLYILHYNQFSSLRKLYTMDLSGNEISNFEIDLRNLNRLALMNLSNNRIEYLSEEMRENLDKINKLRQKEGRNLYIDISNNDLSCACSQIEFVKWIQVTEVKLTNKQNYLCHHPNIGGKVQLNTVDINELKEFCFPKPDYGLYIAVGIVPVGILLIILLAIWIYKRRWKIRYFLYALRHSQKVMNELKGQYEYDGFVVYNELDREFVHDGLLPKLEDELKLTLCVHYRDFIPGHNIEDQIVSSIKQSRKTVLVLTPNFLESHWCDFEMQMARNKLFSDGEDVLVLIILEQFPISKVNKTLKSLLDKKTYLEWYTNKEGQELFWKQLHLALCPAGVSVKSLKQDEVNSTPSRDRSPAGSIIAMGGGSAEIPDHTITHRPTFDFNTARRGGFPSGLQQNNMAGIHNSGFLRS